MANRRKLTDIFIKNYTTDKRVEIYDDLKGVNGLVLRVTPTGHKSFALRYWYNSQSQQFTIGNYGTWSLAEAREKAKELKKLIDEGIDPADEKKKKREYSPQTLLEVVEEYKKKHLPTLKKSTQSDYKARIKHIIKGQGKKKKTKDRGFDGDRYIKDMKRPEIIDFLNDIAKTAPTQAKRIQAILSGIFRFALDREWVTSNIANEITLKYKPKKRKKKWQNVAFDDQQIKTLWPAFEKLEVTGYYFKILFALGQRAGETRLMKWIDIDFKNQLWHIHGVDTKNGLDHYVPLNELALKILDTLHPWTGDSKFVFESEVIKGQPIHSAQKPAARLRKKTGVDDFNIHSIRTTVATRLAGLGTPPQVLSKILNHKKPGEGSTITAIYNKYDYEDEKRKAMNLWNDELQRILSGKGAKIHKISG